MEIIFKLDEQEEHDKADRILNCDDAWSALFEIDYKLRSIQKIDPTKNRLIELVHEVRETIADTRVHEIYN